MRIRGWKLAAGVFLFILFYYRGFSRNYIGGDDVWLIDSAPKGLGRVLELFSDIGGTYRPIPFSLFSIYRLFGENTVLMHWIPIVLHAANSVLVLAFAGLFTSSRFAALTSALVYSLSHIVFFDVYTLTGLVDQIFMVVSLITLFALVKYLRTGRKGWFWMSAGTFVVAIFSKESFVSIALVALYLIFSQVGRGMNRKRIGEAAWYFIPTVIYFALKLFFYREQGEAYTYNIQLDQLTENILHYGLWLVNWRHGWQMGMPYEPNRFHDVFSFMYALMLGQAAHHLLRKHRSEIVLPAVIGIAGLVPFYFLKRALPFYAEFTLIGVSLLIVKYANTLNVRRVPFLILVLVFTVYFSQTSLAQWVKYSFSARGVEAAEQYKLQVVDAYDWSKYKKLCLNNLGEYELWATGVGQLVNLGGERVEVQVVRDCARDDEIQIEWDGGSYVSPKEKTDEESSQ